MPNERKNATNYLHEHLLRISLTRKQRDEIFISDSDGAINLVSGLALRRFFVSEGVEWRLVKSGQKKKVR